jgi:predicted RNA binding protein YcfA (HicA-like mRNA interferase family)
VKYSEFIRTLKRNGWYEVRQSGSHVIMEHPDKENHITVPDHGSKEIGKGLQIKIMKQAGLK